MGPFNVAYRATEHRANAFQPAAGLQQQSEAAWGSDDRARRRLRGPGKVGNRSRLSHYRWVRNRAPMPRAQGTVASFLKHLACRRVAPAKVEQLCRLGPAKRSSAWLNVRVWRKWETLTQ